MLPNVMLLYLDLIATKKRLIRKLLCLYMYLVYCKGFGYRDVEFDIDAASFFVCYVRSED